MKPSTSVLVERSLPLSSQSVLAAPTARARSSGSEAASAAVADLVYAPLETGLLAAARKRGLPTADGLGMLLHQAVRGFALWFGVRPEVTPELRALIEADLVK